jgi:hypothetical protein
VPAQLIFQNHLPRWIGRGVRMGKKGELPMPPFSHEVTLNSHRRCRPH